MSGKFNTCWLMARVMMGMLEDAVWLTGVIMFGTRAWDMWHGQSSELGESLSPV